MAGPVIIIMAAGAWNAHRQMRNIQPSTGKRLLANESTRPGEMWDMPYGTGDCPRNLVGCVAQSRHKPIITVAIQKPTG